MTHSDGPHLSLLGGNEDLYALWDAAYVLGSLSTNERAEYEAHLGDCVSCRAAVSQLSGTPALLGLLDREDVMTLGEDHPEPPGMRPELLGTLLTKVSRRRRRGRFMTWTMAAASVLVIAVFIGVQTNPALPAPAAPQATASGLTMAPVTATALEATVSLVSQSWGTRIEMACTYGMEPDDSEHDHTHDAGDKLAMVVVARDGSHSQLGTWMAPVGVTTLPSGSTSMTTNDIASVQVVSASTGEVFLQRNL